MAATRSPDCREPPARTRRRFRHPVFGGGCLCRRRKGDRRIDRCLPSRGRACLNASAARVPEYAPVPFGSGPFDRIRARGQKRLRPYIIAVEDLANEEKRALSVRLLRRGNRMAEAAEVAATMLGLREGDGRSHSEAALQRLRPRIGERDGDRGRQMRHVCPRLKICPLSRSVSRKSREKRGGASIDACRVEVELS
jgi:hypothetical protein